MGTEQSKPAGLELALGIPVDNLPDRHMLAGHVGDDAVLFGGAAAMSSSRSARAVTPDHLHPARPRRAPSPDQFGGLARLRESAESAPPWQIRRGLHIAEPSRGNSGSFHSHFPDQSGAFPLPFPKSGLAWG